MINQVIINIAVLLLYGLVFALYKTKKNKINEKIKGRNFKITSKKVKGNMEFLNPGKNIKEEIETYNKKKIRIILLIIFLFNTISLLANLQIKLSNDKELLTVLNRPVKGNKTYELSVRIEELLDNVNLVIQVEETWMSKEEVKEYFKEGYEYLKEVILGENPSFDEVNFNLYFPSNIPDTDIEVTWETENYQYIDGFGNIKVSDINEEIPTYVRAILKYKEYKEEFDFHVKLVPEKLDEANKVLKDLNKIIFDEEKKQREDNKLILPTDINGKAIEFHEGRKEEGHNFLLFGFLIAMVIYILHDAKLAEEMQVKNKVLVNTYPEIVSKLTLLMSAGMTIGKSWERIVFEYKKKGIHNYAYEEMEATYYEIQKGISEGNAYGVFGKRCRLHPYIKLGGLLEQNLKRGNRNLEHLLREEVKDAFEDRKSRARKLGEEASTKLLMPMFLMLAVVLIICMAPAFMTF